MGLQAQARVLAEKRVGRVDGIGKKEIRSGVRRLFEALGTAGPGRDAAIAAVLKKNSVYSDFEHHLGHISQLRPGPQRCVPCSDWWRC